MGDGPRVQVFKLRRRLVDARRLLHFGRKLQIFVLRVQFHQNFMLSFCSNRFTLLFCILLFSISCYKLVISCRGNYSWWKKGRKYHKWSQRKDLVQWFLTFFASWTPKSQKKFHGPLNYQIVILVDPWIPVKEVWKQKFAFVIFTDPLDPLHGRFGGPWTPG